jgi:putative Holliday junction resolvase
MSPYLGIDYGSSRCGIAVSDPSDTLATAVATHREGRDGSLLERLRELVAAYQIDAIVVGWPLTVRGEAGAMAQRVQRFADRLERTLGLPVVLLDERYTSQEAERALRGRGRRRAKGDIDALAAELILQTYLDRRRAEAPYDPS